MLPDARKASFQSGSASVRFALVRARGCLFKLLKKVSVYTNEEGYGGCDHSFALNRFIYLLPTTLGGCIVGTIT